MDDRTPHLGELKLMVDTVEKMITLFEAVPSQALDISILNQEHVVWEFGLVERPMMEGRDYCLLGPPGKVRLVCEQCQKCKPPSHNAQSPVDNLVVSPDQGIATLSATSSKSSTDPRQNSAECSLKNSRQVLIFFL
jgi:hypothetical protein